MTWPGCTAPVRRPSMATASSSNTLASPAKRRMPAGTAASFTSAPSGASEPRITISPGSRAKGSSSVRMTLSSMVSGSASSSPMLRPDTLRALPSTSGPRRCITARTPPAASRSSMRSGPLGRICVSMGTVSAQASNSAITSTGHCASVAMAMRWRMTLTEQPVATAVRTALRSAAGVRIWRGRRSSRTMSTMRAPACAARACRRGPSARMGELPGSAMPRASARQCMELAVAKPAQTPGPSMAARHMPCRPSSESWPAFTVPTAL